MHWVAVFDEESHNLQAAVDWSISAGEARLGLRLGCAVMEQWGQRRKPREVTGWIQACLDACPVIEDRLRGRALMSLGLATDDMAVAAALACEALPLARATQDARVTCWCLRMMSAAPTSDNSAVTAYTTQALDVARASGDPVALAVALMTQLCTAETFAESRSAFDEIAPVLQQMGDQMFTAVQLCCIGWLAMNAGEHDFAERALNESVALMRRIGDLRDLAFALTNRGMLSLLRGDLAAARPTLLEALRHSRDMALEAPLPESLLGLSVIAAHEGRAEHAAMLAGASATARGDEPLSPAEQELHDRHIEPQRAAGSGWSDNWRRGAALDRDQAIALGLTSTPERRQPDSRRPDG